MPNPKKTIYLDHAAATPMSKKVFAAMKPFAVDYFANPSALYRDAQFIRTALAQARKDIATVLKTNPDTIILTRGGTESINMAILGAARKHASHGKHIVTTKTEHAAVGEAVKQLEREGFFVTYVPVDEVGRISLSELKTALRKDTVLVTIMYANNEIGTIAPIADIGRLLLKWRKEHKTSYPLFHTDACQAANYLPLQADQLHVDLLSLNGAKVYGPKGAGILYKRRGVEIAPLVFGGGHEQGLRPGTEDVSSVVGLAAALQESEALRGKEVKRLQALRNYFYKQLQKNIPDVFLNGPDVNREDRLANNLNVSFSGAESESIILYLDAKGVACASGSACSTDSDEPSHVLTACGLSKDRIASSIRFTLGRSTKKSDIDTVMEVLPGIIEKVRKAQARQ